MFSAFLFVLLAMPRFSLGIVGYDCSDPKVRISKYSLLDLPDCDNSTTLLSTESRIIQILQRRQYLASPAYSCLIEAITTTYHCGMHSHLSLHQHGLRSYIVPVSQSECNTIIKTRTYHFEGGHPVTGIKVNSTSSTSFTSHGTVDSNGGCTGTSWTSASNGRTYSASVQQVHLSITVREFFVLYSTDRSGVRLPEGKICENLASGCFDSTLGFVYFEGLASDACGSTTMDVLYEGLANVTTFPPGHQLTGRMVTVDSPEQELALRIKGKTTICHHMVYDTELPEIFISMPDHGLFYFQKGPILPENIKAFTHINAKLVTFEHHIAKQLVSLADKASMVFCLQEREQLKTLLTLARIAPSEFAYQFLDQQQGVYAETAGEVVVVIECPPTTVQFRKNIDFCSDEMAVTHNNRSRFLIPRSRILTDSPTLRECTPLAPTTFKFSGEGVAPFWVTTDQAMSQVPRPATISLEKSTRMTWTYEYLTSWVNAGIYKDEDLKKFEQRILGSHVMQGVTSSLARAMTDSSELLGPYKLDNLIPDATAVRVLRKGWASFWSGVSVFGTYVASFLGVYWIVVIIKQVISVAVNVKILHETIGWSWRLVYGVWGGFTKLFLHRHAYTHPPAATASAPEPLDPLLIEMSSKARL